MVVKLECNDFFNFMCMLASTDQKWNGETDSALLPSSGVFPPKHSAL